MNLRNTIITELFPLFLELQQLISGRNSQLPRGTSCGVNLGFHNNDRNMTDPGNGNRYVILVRIL